MRASGLSLSPALRLQQLWLPGVTSHATTPGTALLRGAVRPAHVAAVVTVRCFASAALGLTRRAPAPAPPSSSTTTNTTAATTTSSSSTSGSVAAAPPVTPVLLDTLRVIISRHTPGTWMSVSDLYNDLPPRMRREHVRPHRSMLRVLQRSSELLGIKLNEAGTHYAVGHVPAVDVATEATARRLKDEQRRHQQQSAAKQGAVTSKVFAAKTDTTAHVDSEKEVMDQLADGVVARVTVFYDVQLHTFPPPPPDQKVATAYASQQTTRSSADGAVIAMSDFVCYIPPFFAPVQAVLANMPGYTEAHLRQYFQAAAMESVTVCGVAYIRLHGGYGKLSLADSGAAEARFAAYRPDPSLLPHFVRAFEGITEKWMPLPELLRRVDPAVVAQLPFQGPSAILYFAQMQHRFAFAVRQAPPKPQQQQQQHGESAMAPVTEAAVLLRSDDYGGLQCDTSPTPRAVQHLLFSLIPHEGHVVIDDLVQQLAPDLRDEANAFYGGVRQLLEKHAPLFYIPPANPSVVMRTAYFQRTHIATLSLEEQLQHATEKANKNKMRILRRRIAFRDNPSHPLHDPENLAKELSKHLPRRGFTTVKAFLKRGIPEEVVMFLPPKVHNFFKNHPQYFVQFEHQHAGQWCLSRVDQPLPSGVIRQTFTDQDVVRLVAEYLQRKGPRSTSTVYLNLPRGAQEIIKRAYTNMYLFVTQFPQYFNVVLQSDNDNAHSSGVIHLVQVPSVELSPSSRAASAKVGGGSRGRAETFASSSALSGGSKKSSSSSSSSSTGYDDNEEDEDEDDGLD